MKSVAVLMLLCIVVAICCINSAQAIFCPCDLSDNKEKVCGSNGVTYKNRCEFECTQREYQRLGRQLNYKSGACKKKTI